MLGPIASGCGAAEHRHEASLVQTILLNDSPGLTVRRARVRDHALSRVRARSLDAALIAGRAPDSGLAIALRAQRLIGHDERRRLAAALRALVAVAHAPGPTGGMRAPVSRSTVLGCAAALEDLADRLGERGPVAARGVALAGRLLSDGAGPAHDCSQRAGARAFAAAVDEARLALTTYDLTHHRREPPCSTSWPSH